MYSIVKICEDFDGYSHISPTHKLVEGEKAQEGRESHFNSEVVISNFLEIKEFTLKEIYSRQKITHVIFLERPYILRDRLEKFDEIHIIRIGESKANTLYLFIY